MSQIFIQSRDVVIWCVICRVYTISKFESCSRTQPRDLIFQNGRFYQCHSSFKINDLEVLQYPMHFCGICVGWPKSVLRSYWGFKICSFSGSIFGIRTKNGSDKPKMMYTLVIWLTRWPCIFFAQSPCHSPRFTWLQAWVKYRVDEIRVKLHFTLTLVRQENLRLFCKNEGSKIIIL